MALEDKLRSEEQARGSELENKVAGAPQAKKGFGFSTIYHASTAVASTIGSYAMVGINGPLTGLAFMVGKGLLSAFKKTKTSFNDMLDELAVGSLAGIVGSKLYEYAAKLIPNPTLMTKIFRGAAGIIIGNPIFVGAYLTAEYAVRKPYDIPGIFRHVKNNFWKTTIKVNKYLGIPVALTINGYLGGYPGIVAMDVGYRVIVGVAEGKGKKLAPNYQPQPAYGGAS